MASLVSSAPLPRLFPFPLAITLLLLSSFLTPLRSWAAQALWIGANSPGPGIEELTPSEISQGGSPSPVTIRETVLQNAAGMAFQKNNLWVATLDNTVMEFTSKQLKTLSKNPTPAPVVSITSGAFQFILGSVFDKHGNLWILDTKIDGIHELTAAQLKSGTADLMPAVTITSTDLASPAFATFDKAGNLWISSEGNNRLAEFSIAQLSTDGSATPDVVINSPNLDGPGQLQFDSKGSLWVTNALNSTVTAFSKSQLKSSGSPEAAIILSATPVGTGASLDTPWGLQFDNSGNLWVFNYTSGSSTASTISKFQKKQLAATGAPTPSVFLIGLPLYSAELTFGPPSK